MSVLLGDVLSRRPTAAVQRENKTARSEATADSSDSHMYVLIVWQQSCTHQFGGRSPAHAPLQHTRQRGRVLLINSERRDQMVGGCRWPTVLTIYRATVVFAENSTKVDGGRGHKAARQQIL